MKKDYLIFGAIILLFCLVGFSIFLNFQRSGEIDQLEQQNIEFRQETIRLMSEGSIRVDYARGDLDQEEELFTMIEELNKTIQEMKQ